MKHPILSRITAVFAAAAIACLINYGQPTVYGIGFASVVLHEATHLLLMRVFGCSHSFQRV